jgi:hypothetical protein
MTTVDSYAKPNQSNTVCQTKSKLLQILRELSGRDRHA